MGRNLFVTAKPRELRYRLLGTGESEIYLVCIFFIDVVLQRLHAWLFEVKRLDLNDVGDCGLRLFSFQREHGPKLNLPG